MSGLEAHEKIITGRHSMTQNINDTMAKQKYKTKGVPSSDKVCSSLSRSPMGLVPKRMLLITCIKKNGGGFDDDEIPETFCQRKRCR